MGTCSLEDFRSQMDQIDADLVHLLRRRFAVCEAIAHYKAKYDIPIMQPDRIIAVKERVAGLALREGLDPDVVSALYDKIIIAACALETRIISHRASGSKGADST